MSRAATVTSRASWRAGFHAVLGALATALVLTAPPAPADGMPSNGLSQAAIAPMSADDLAGARPPTNAAGPPEAAFAARPSGLLPKPARFRDLAERLDFIHHNLPLDLQSRVNRADARLAGEPFDPEASGASGAGSSRFRLRAFLNAEYDEHLSIEADPAFDADVSLPHLEQRWKVFVTTFDSDELPGVDPFERRSRLRAGLRHVVRNWHVDADAGIRTRWVPAVFGRLEWRPALALDPWMVRPRERVFWESDDGPGEVSSLSFSRPLDPGRHWVFEEVAAVKWMEREDGVEWEQTVKLGHVPVPAIAGEPPDRSTGTAPRRYGVRYSVFGRAGNGFALERHRLTLFMRKAIYQRWLFLGIEPEAEWREEDEWSLVPRLRIGLDALFGDGTGG